MKFILNRIYLILVIALLSTHAYSTTYTTVQDGPWTSSSTWDANGVPPTTYANNIINVNHSVTITSDLDISYYNTTIANTGEISGAYKITVNASGAEINNYGKIDIADLTLGWGTPTVNNYGDLLLSGTLDNSGNINNIYQSTYVSGYIEAGYIILKENTLTNDHHIKVINDLTIQGSAGLTNNTSGTLYVVNDIIITANTTITNNGDVYVDGTIDNSNGNLSGTGQQCNSDGSSNIPTASGGSISCSSGIGPITPTFPIELISFSAEIESNNINIYWSTASEKNNDYFTIARSLDHEKWETVKIISGAGNSNKTLEYSIIDYNPHKNDTYYRLMQTDYDGKFTFSKIVAINNSISNTEKISIYPNPANDIINIDGIENTNELTIYNSVGQLVNSNIDIIETYEGSLKINISELPTGLFFIKTPTQTIKLIKQ